MDETTRVIIESSITILGMIAAFLAAFLAEPIKNHFQNKNKLHNLRVALYKEILHNYVSLTNHDHISLRDKEAKIDDPYPLQTIEHLIRHSLRNECYRNAIQNEVSLFYQLDEAQLINIIQGTAIGMLINLSSDIESLFGKKSSKGMTIAGFKTSSKLFRETYELSVYSRAFDRKIMSKLMTEEQYKEILDRGREVSKTVKDI